MELVSLAASDHQDDFGCSRSVGATIDTSCISWVVPFGEARPARGVQGTSFGLRCSLCDYDEMRKQKRVWPVVRETERGLLEILIVSEI